MRFSALGISLLVSSSSDVTSFSPNYVTPATSRSATCLNSPQYNNPFQHSSSITKTYDRHDFGITMVEDPDMKTNGETNKDTSQDMQMEAAFSDVLNQQQQQEQAKAAAEEINKAKNAVQVALEERNREEELALKNAEISQLLQQKQDRETKINRLKFQLNEFKQALEDSENQKIEVEKELDTFLSEKAEVRDDLDAQSRENDSLEEELRAVSNELEEVKLMSKEGLEQAKIDAEEEKKALVSEIDSLKSVLDETTAKINAAEQDMKNIAKDSKMELESQRMQISQKDEEINQLTALKENLLAEIDSLNGQLDELKNALADSEKVTSRLEKEMDAMKKENERALKLEQGLTKKFMQEKDSLTEKLQTYARELMLVKRLKEEELNKLKAVAEDEKQQLRSEISFLNTELEKVRKQMKTAKDEASRAKQEADIKVKRQREESRRLDRAVKAVAAKEKKALKKQIWDLETIADSAKYYLFAAQKEAKELKASIVSFEKQIAELEASNLEQVQDLEEKMRAAEMFYAGSKAAGRERMVNFVQMFQRRMARREQRAKQDIENLRQSLFKQFDMEKDKMKVEGEQAVEAMRITGVTNLDNAKKEFDAKVIELDKQMSEAEKKSRIRMNEMKLNFDRELKKQLSKFEKEKEEIIAQKNLEIQQTKDEAQRLYDLLQVNMNIKLKKSRDEAKALRTIINEKDGIIRDLEMERQSFRALARLTWKATKAKIGRKRKGKR